MEPSSWHNTGTLKYEKEYPSSVLERKVGSYGGPAWTRTRDHAVMSGAL